MERISVFGFNSPIIQRNTPIKRLGLSRKRKSCGLGCNLNSKIQAFSDGSPAGAASEKYLSENEMEAAEKDFEDKVIESTLNYDEKLDLLNKRITEGEEKLKTLQTVKNNIVQLEELIDLWKSGCKSAFLYFIELLKERQSEEIDLKSVLNKLGIWEIMVENFENDQDISLME